MIEPPLPFAGAVCRWFYVLVRGLVERGHRVTVLAACSKPDEIAATQEFFPAPQYDVRAFPFPPTGGWRSKWNTIRRPHSYMFSTEFRAALQSVLAGGYDILHAEQLWAGWLVPPGTPRSIVNLHYLASIDLAEVPRTNWVERKNH
ncbi:MAG: glycosyltransferase, partial [Gemmataceae bacterium]